MFESASMLQRLNALRDDLRKLVDFPDVPVRYGFMALCVFGALLALFSVIAFGVGWLPLLVFGDRKSVV